MLVFTQSPAPRPPPLSTNLASSSPAANRSSEAPHKLVLGTPTFHPFADGFSKPLNLAFEEMIHVFHHNQFIFPGQSPYNLFEFPRISKFVVRPVHEQLRL